MNLPGLAKRNSRKNNEIIIHLVAIVARAISNDFQKPQEILTKGEHRD
jgi:hypothetical protein